MNWHRTWYLIKSDIWRRVINNGHSRTKSAFIQVGLSPSCLAVIIFRLQHFFYTNNYYIFAKLFAVSNIVLFSVEIGSECEIEEGFCLGHANGIIIHQKTRIGKNCTIMHQTGLGYKLLEDPKEDDWLTLGDNVLVGAGVRFLGPLTIGKNSVIAMNSLVLNSAPENSLIMGCPAKRHKNSASATQTPSEKTGRNWKNRPKCTLRQTMQRIKEDLVHRSRLDGKPFSFLAYFRVLFNPPALAVIVYRFSHWLDGCGFSHVVKLLNVINVVFFNTEIGAKASIKGGFILLHSNGVLINHQVRIGKNVICAHHNSIAIGPRAGMDPENDFVDIGDNTFLGAGARVVGNLSIGHNCIMAMNAVLTKSAPDNSIIMKGKIKPKPDIPQNTTSTTTHYPPPKISLRETITLIKADVSRRATIEGKQANLFYYIKIVLNPPVLAVILFRISHFASCRGKIWYPLAKLLYIINTMLFSVEIQSRAQIGPGLILAHANGILIHDTSIIGKNCTFMFQNTLTISQTINDRVVLGDDVIVGMGARIIGPVKIGHRSLISANAVVTKDAPEDAILFGIPARKIGKRK